MTRTLDIETRYGTLAATVTEETAPGLFRLAVTRTGRLGTYRADAYLEHGRLVGADDIDDERDRAELSEAVLALVGRS